MVLFSIIWIFPLITTNAFAFTPNQNTFFQIMMNYVSTFLTPDQIITDVAEKAALDIAAGKNVSDIGKQVVSNMIGCMNGDQKKVFTTFSMTLVMLFGVNGTNNFINTAIEVVSNNCKAFFTQCQQKVQALASQEQDYETIKEQAYGWTNTFLSETTIHLIMCRFKDRFISSDWAKIRGPLLKLVTKYDDTCGS